MKYALINVIDYPWFWGRRLNFNENFKTTECTRCQNRAINWLNTLDNFFSISWHCTAFNFFLNIKFIVVSCSTRNVADWQNALIKQTATVYTFNCRTKTFSHTDRKPCFPKRLCNRCQWWSTETLDRFSTEFHFCYREWCKVDQHSDRQQWCCPVRKKHYAHHWPTIFYFLLHKFVQLILRNIRGWFRITN